MFPIEITYCIIKQIDRKDHESLYKAARLNRTWGEVVFKTYPDLKIGHKTISKMLQTDNIVPWTVLEKLGTRVTTWADLCVYDKCVQGMFMKKKLIEYTRVSLSVMPPTLRTEGSDYKAMVLPAILFRVWYPMFTKVMDISRQEEDTDRKGGTLMQSVGGAIPMTGLAGALPGLLTMLNVGKSKKKVPDLLYDLTSYILAEFRRDLMIDDRFIECCFRNKMEKTLYRILDFKKFYKFNLTEDTLENTYLLLSAKTDNIDVFCNMLSRTEVTLNHITWITKYAPVEFLMSMAKVRRSIPRFDMMIVFLNENLETKTWKQKDFFQKILNGMI